jgi:nucleoside-diphosphate-sugar epimerase
MMVARVTERALRPLGIQPPLHPRRMNFYRKSFAFDLVAAREALGFQPRIDLDEGMRTTARWYREQGLVS